MTTLITIDFYMLLVYDFYDFIILCDILLIDTFYV